MAGKEIHGFWNRMTQVYGENGEAIMTVMSWFSATYSYVEGAFQN